MKSYSARLADIIAREIITTKSRKKWRSLNDDAQREIKMATERSSTTTSSMDVNDGPATRIPIDTGKATAALVSEGQKPLAGASGSDSINSGFAVGSQVVVGGIKPVDRRTLQGSTPGDYRVHGDYATMDEIANPPGPRDAVRQYKGSKNETDPGFQSTVDSTEIGG